MEKIVYSIRKVIYKDYELSESDTQKVLERAKEVEKTLIGNYPKSTYVIIALDELLDKREICGNVTYIDEIGEEKIAVRIKKENGEGYPIE